MTRWLSVVGIGEDGLAGLAPVARTLVETAETLVGGARHLAMVPPGSAERLAWRRPLPDTIPEIAARCGRRVTVLASGDPMWFGCGVMLAQRFSAAEMTVVPHPGAFSLAAARLGWGIADCTTLSVHGRPLDTLRLHLAPGARLLLLSEDGDTPRKVASLLAQSGWGSSRMTVLEHLGGERETVLDGTAQQWGERQAADLNTIAIDCTPTPGTRALPHLAGLPDDAFEHDGQLTKREVRAATLARLAPLPGDRLWDIGAGSGSIAIEWLRATSSARAIAVERNPARAAMIARNAAILGVPGLEVVIGTAPEAVASLQPPDAVFVGGGIADPALLPALWAALRSGGQLVANVVSTEGERALLDWQAQHGGELVRLAVSHAEKLAGHHVWRPLMTVTQLSQTKPG